VGDPLPRPLGLPITETNGTVKRKDTTNKDKRGIIDKMHLFIMSDNNNDTNLISSNLPIKQIRLARNNDVLFKDHVVAEALYHTGASHNCISEKL
jgi:hypothetical protein